MNDYIPFLNTCAERPDDDGPRLVFADWLEERGDPWGEYIRNQIEIYEAPLLNYNKDMTYSQYNRKAERNQELYNRYGHIWTKICVRGLAHSKVASSWNQVINFRDLTIRWSRGLPDSFMMSFINDWRAIAPAIKGLMAVSYVHIIRVVPRILPHNHFAWYSPIGDIDETHRLPSDIYELLDGWQSESSDSKMYMHPTDARKALSWALIKRYIR